MLKRFMAVGGFALGTIVLGAGLMSAASAASFVAASISTADARSMCDNANKQFTSGLSLRNAAAIGALYAVDALLQPPGGVEASGRPAITRFWEHTMADGATGLALSIDATDVTGEVIVENGRYALISGQVGVVETGKYLIVRKREAGQWRIFRHIWNASQPSSGGS